MGGVFLTEGHRLKPRLNKPKRKRLTLKKAVRPHVPNPAHVTGSSDDECLVRDIGLASGCYAMRGYR